MSISFAIRPFRQGDLPAVLELFWETVHTVNADAYSADQLDAWAPADPDIQAWKTSLAAHRAYVAVDGAGKLVGFGDITRGHIDRLYVRASCLGQGIGSALLHELERDALRPRYDRYRSRSCSTSADVTSSASWIYPIRLP